MIEFIMGIIVMIIIYDRVIVKVIVILKFWKKCLIMFFMFFIGIKIESSIVEIVIRVKLIFFISL